MGEPVGRRCMPESSILEMTAEIAVAFAGFIGIFLALATRDGRFPPSESFTIRTIVISSVSPVFYCAVPLILNTFGISGEPLWRLSRSIRTFLWPTHSVCETIRICHPHKSAPFPTRSTTTREPAIFRTGGAGGDAQNASAAGPGSTTMAHSTSAHIGRAIVPPSGRGLSTDRGRVTCGLNRWSDRHSSPDIGRCHRCSNGDAGSRKSSRACSRCGSLMV